MAFITDLTTAGGKTGIYVGGLPSGVDNDMGSIRGDLGSRSAASSGAWGGVSFGEGNPVITIISGVGPVQAANTAAATFNQGNQVINAAQTGIAGTANTTLKGGQTDSANVSYTPLQIDILRTYFYKTAVVAGNWNEFTGAFSSGPTNAVSGMYDIARAADTAGNVRASGTDYAANPTQDIPGRITYRDGSPNPIQSGYGPRYNW